MVLSQPSPVAALWAMCHCYRAGLECVLRALGCCIYRVCPHGAKVRGGRRGAGGGAKSVGVRRMQRAGEGGRQQLQLALTPGRHWSWSHSSCLPSPSPIYHCFSKIHYLPCKVSIAIPNKLTIVHLKCE